MVQRLWLVVFVFGAALISGCFSPEFRDNAIMCGPDGECPPGMSCVNLVCRSGGLTQDATTFYTLTVTKGGDGPGTVTSTPTGIDCGGDCSEELPSATMVTLTATPGTDATFVGWTGACSGTGTCTVTLNADTTVTAMFALQYSLVLALSGNGSGFVTSLPAGINCGADCTESYSPNTMVALTGFAAAGSTFEGWSGTAAANCTSNAPCTVTIDQAKMVTATFTLLKHVVTIVPAGTGSGAVTATGGGIDCGVDCTEAYDHGSTVTLTATPTAGSTFGGWSGGGCSGVDPCMVSVTQATEVTATWNLTTVALTVDRQGNGTVTSTPVGIDCGSTCSANFNYNTSVTLGATPAVGSVFSGWSGGTGDAATCSGTGSCVVPLTQASMVTATFALTTPTLTAAKNGNGTGTVTSNTGGIDCGGDCTENPTYGSTVTLTAMAAPGSVFMGWTGGNPACSGTGTCMTTIDGAQTITATFTLTTHDLTVMTTGAGTVTGPNINCGQGNTDCTETYNYNTSVSLTATPAVGSTFTSWSGGGCSGNGGCITTMNMAQTVTATFTLTTHQLTVANAGAGSGRITSDDTNLDCGIDCVHVYPYNSTVELTADPDVGSTFVNWTNGCGTTNPCDVSVTTARTVTANYALAQYQLSVTKNGGTGGGTVVANVGALNCGGDCNDMYNHNTVVTLTATPNGSSVFDGWTDAICMAFGTGDCVITMTAAHTANASFTLGTNALTVSKPGTGSGTVTSTGGYVDCGADCGETAIPNGTMITFTATAATGSTFMGWSVNGDGGTACPGMGTCLVTIDGTAVNVAANFAINSYNLTVMGSGNGSGVITSAPGAIDCGVGGAAGADCVDPFNHGQVVQLTATADPSSDFTGWSGGGCMGVGTCNVTMDMAYMVVATFAKKTYFVTVRPTGAGSGTVTSDVGDINCGSTCNDFYEHGTALALTAVPGTGSDFNGWSGVVCGGTGDTCLLTVTSELSIFADFSVEQHTITAAIGGPPGGGTVYAIEPDGVIDCPGDCSETVDYDTHVTLKAEPATGYEFTGWSGVTEATCTGTGNCELDITQAYSVTANFALKTYTLTVNVNGNGEVESTPVGINCIGGGGVGNDCTEVYDHGTNVSLAATPATGSVFGSWTGGPCAGTSTNPCVVPMTQDRGATAQFNLTTHLLTINRTGNGRITSNPTGIDCSQSSADCTELYNYNTSVILTPTPSPGWQFSGWPAGSGCTGTGTCTVSMTTAQTIATTFTVIPPNYVFVLNATVTGDVNGIAGADALCDAAADAAGGPPAGTYIAYLSTSSQSATQRLTAAGASGWIRFSDDRPVFNAVADIVAGHMFYPIKFTETGATIAEGEYAMTATTSTGAFAAAYTACPMSGNVFQDGTSTAAVMAGFPNANATTFSSYATPTCASTMRLYCFGVDRAAIIQPPPGSYRRAFTTVGLWGPQAGGIATADAVCQSEAINAGLTTGAAGQPTFKALLATTTASAISRFNTGGLPWARPDNTVITASASSMSSVFLTYLLASPNSNAANTAWYTTQSVWTGNGTLHGMPSATSSTCGNWTSTTSTGRTGLPAHTQVSKWFGGDGSLDSCSFARKLYCLQE